MGVWRGVTIEYSHIADRLYFGFEARGGFNLAMPEKALLDCIYYRNSVPFEDELELEGLDTERLQEMAQSFPVRVREMAGKLLGTSDRDGRLIPNVYATRHTEMVGRDGKTA